MVEENSPDALKVQLKANNILFSALVTGIIIFTVIVIVLIKFNGPFFRDDSMDKILLIVATVIATISLISSASVYSKRTRDTANSDLALNEKLNNYRSMLIIYLAACEGGALFSVICLLLTSNYWFILIIVIMLAAMLFKRPTKQRVINDLQLNWQEQQQL